jgi:hypothetical protein
MEADISILLKTGHFYSALKSLPKLGVGWGIMLGCLSRKLSRPTPRKFTHRSTLIPFFPESATSVAVSAIWLARAKGSNAHGWTTNGI